MQKIKRGRPRLQQQNKHSQVIRTTLTCEQRDQVEAEAARLGVTVSAFIRARVLWMEAL